MPKYLFTGSYTEEGLQGLLKDGGSGRKEAVDQLMKSLGGTLEAIYFAFGDNDVFVIADLPDNVSCAAGALMVSASGTFRTKTVVLLTPEEVDQAVKKTVDYRPPGQ